MVSCLATCLVMLYMQALQELNLELILDIKLRQMIAACLPVAVQCRSAGFSARSTAIGLAW